MNLNENNEKNNNSYEELNSNKLKKQMQNFSQEHSYYYELELKKEEEEMISLLDKPDEEYLTSKGIFINNLILTDKGFTTYGKIEINLQSIIHFYINISL